MIWLQDSRETPELRGGSLQTERRLGNTARRREARRVIPETRMRGRRPRGRGAALLVPAGVDAGLISVALSGRGIFVEGAITPGATTLSEEPKLTEEPASTEEPVREAEERPHKHEAKR
jgi:hypothetical protein